MVGAAAVHKGPGFLISSSSSCVSIVTWQSSEAISDSASSRPPHVTLANAIVPLPMLLYPCQCYCRLRTVYYLVISLPLCRHPTPLRERGKRSDQEAIGKRETIRKVSISDRHLDFLLPPFYSADQLNELSLAHINFVFTQNIHIEDTNK